MEVKACTNTPTVLNIESTPEVVIFHKVVVPTSVGDEDEFPPSNGLYKNVLLVYEINNHIYFYSSDGIPTRLEAGLTSFTDLTNRPKYNGQVMDGNTNIPEVPEDIVLTDNNFTDAYKAKLDGLATVASTGAYADLSGTPTVPVITMSTTDPGEGSPLAANNFIAYYGG